MTLKQILKNYEKLYLKKIWITIFLLGSHLYLFSQQMEYTMKAVAFEKLALFITWPKNTIENNPTTEFTIAVLGQNPFNGILEEVYKEKNINEKKVKIIYLKDIKKLVSCDILFISGSNIDKLPEILSAIKGQPILTVSETEGFIEAGCFINFYEFENKLRFEINQKGMTEAGFTIDYRLLRVSKVLNPT